MADQQTAPAQAAADANVSPEVRRALRKKLRREGKKKLVAKLRTDKEFAKIYFGAKSKRSTEKKSVFRKKKSRKK